jgi:hypothetical protein
MQTGRRPEFGVCAAVDVHYLSTGGARAAAVLAADAAFAHVLAERTAVLPRHSPTGRASSTGANSRRCTRSWTIYAGWACWSSTATPTWTPPAGPAWARMRTPSSASR